MEDYEKKYKEAMARMESWARGEHPECFSEAQKAAEFVFPELKKSEDEKIKEDLIAWFKNYPDQLWRNHWVKEVIAWIRDHAANPFTGTGFDFNNHHWGMCARDGGIDVLIDGHLVTHIDDTVKTSSIQWKGNNLKEVVDFTGLSPKFGEWFKTWDDYVKYVHGHNNIFKLFNGDGSHYEVPVGAWIVKTPDGYNVASRAKYIESPTNTFNILDLTWEDINNLEEIINQVHYEFRNGISAEGFGREVLEQFLNCKNIPENNGIATDGENIQKALLTKFIGEKNKGAKYDIHGVSIDDIIVWLEKRGQLKSVNSLDALNWKPASEIPTAHWEHNNSISPLYLVKCEGNQEGKPIIGYARYSFVTDMWMNCIHATIEGIYKVIEWVDDGAEDKTAIDDNPKFRVGDTIKPKDGGHEPWEVKEVDMVGKKYRFNNGYVVDFSHEDAYELTDKSK